MSQHETPRTFTPEQSEIMYQALQDTLELLETDEPYSNMTSDAAKHIRHMLQALATPPAATEPAQEAGDVRSLKNRNTETFEAVAEYHRGNFYAAPVLYHNREIMCWHVYDKTDDKDKYCVARNIRTRLLAIAHIDRLNARARGGA